LKKKGQIAVLKNTLAIRNVGVLLSITEKLLKKEFSHCIFIHHERAQIAKLVNNNVCILRSDFLQEYVPLAIGFTKKGICYVGERALNMWKTETTRNVDTKTNSCVEFLRTLGTGHYYNFPNMNKAYSSTELLTDFLKYICSLETEIKITDSLVIVPDSFSSRQLNELKKAANLASLSNILFIHKSIAIQNFFKNNLTNTVDFALVIAINKTSSTITLVKDKRVIDTETDDYWGGIYIDQLIVNKFLIPHLKDNFKISNLLSDERKLKNLHNALLWHAESVKIELSNKREFALLTYLGDLTNDDNGKDMEIDLLITVDELEDALKEDFSYLIRKINVVIFRNNISIKQISEIYLSGANTRIPLLKKMLLENFIEPKIDQENHNAAIIGGTLFLNEINTTNESLYSIIR
jgi:molecular chaperone DnaK